MTTFNFYFNFFRIFNIEFIFNFFF